MILFIGFQNSCNSDSQFDIALFEKERIINAADDYLHEEVVTVTNFICERSQGSKNDFYSEGDYWWPNPEDTDGAYIRRDGETNPDNFIAHRQAMRRFSIIVPTLVAAYQITQDEKYADAALKHLKAWFINPASMMNSNLLYSQAIKGRVSGRGIGIIDTIHLIEIAKAIEKLKSLGYLKSNNLHAMINWFNEYTGWLTTHEYGIKERDHGNNHSAWWVAQVAAFSHLTGNKKNMNFCRIFFKEVILPEQIDVEGKFIDELTRTKPYSYSLFNLEAFALIGQILSDNSNNLWDYTTPDGKSILSTFQFMFPFMKEKTKWPYPPDITHFDELPVRGSALLFGGLAYQHIEYIELWKSLESDPIDDEIIRTFVIRQPILWLE